MRWAERIRELPRSAWFLVGANVLPLLGALLLGWDLGTIMALFWAENLVVGVYAILRIALVARWFGLFLVPFFTFHYGIFTLGHGVFVFALFVGEATFVRTLGTVVPAVVALFLSHGASFVTNFLRGGERDRMRAAVGTIKMRKTGPGSWEGDVPADLPPESARGLLDVGKLMSAPYRRVVVMHVTIIAGGFLLAAFGSTAPALALLVVLKTGIDLRAHLQERRKAADFPSAPSA